MSNTPKENRVLELIKQDESYKNYFFRKVQDVKWFYKLKSEGYFNSSDIPEPNEEGTSSWLPLFYLERVSRQIAEGNHLDYSSELIDIVERVSEADTNNSRIWPRIIKIVSNIPNDRIPIELFEYIPVWLEKGINNSLVSSEICEFIPKFLNQNSTKDDICKAETILEKFLTLKKKDSSQETDYFKTRGSSYLSLIDLYWLKRSLIKKNYLNKVAKYCSNKFAYDLAEKLKTLFLDFPEGIKVEISNEDNQGIVHAFVDEDDLLLTTYQQNEAVNFQELESVTLEDFKDYKTSELEKKIKNKLLELGIEYEEIEEEKLNSIAYTLTNDYSTIWCNSIHKLGNDFMSRNEVQENYTLFLRDFLNLRAKEHKDDVEEVIHDFFKEYLFPFFKRIALFVVSENWDAYKTIFWQLVENSDYPSFFSNYHYDKELFFLLKNNSEVLDKEEVTVLKEVIEEGPQDDNYDKDQVKYWQLKWYSALKDNPEFISSYEELSQELDITNEHFESLGEVKTRVGSVSPYTPEELLDMRVHEIVEKIHGFEPGNGIDDPTVEGFARSLKQAVEKNPQNFANKISHFLDVYYIYINNILKGFQSAWEDKKSFNWKEILTFCRTYILSDLFKENKLSLEDDRLGATKSWVIRSVGDLISAGVKKDNNAFKPDLLPIVEEILQEVVPQLEYQDDFKESNMNYPTYSLNSTAGKLLTTLIYYSLRKARLSESNKYKWSESDKELFELAIDKKIIDSFILQGMYFKQFNYLDNEWMEERIKTNLELERDYWSAFMGGYLFNKPIYDREIFSLMAPHFKRAIEQEESFDFDTKRGLVKHLAVYFIWGFDQMEKGSLIHEFVFEADPHQIENLIDFFRRLKGNVEEDQKENLNNSVIDFWEFTVQRFKDEFGEGKRKVLSNLSKLTAFIKTLDSKSFGLLKYSAPYVDYGFNSHFFIDELVRLKDNDGPAKKPLYIAKLFQLMLENSTPDYEQEKIVELLSYLYKKNEKIQVKKIADEICLEYGKRGYDFLRELYNKNK